MAIDHTDPYTFKPGVYVHYKGGQYTALMLVRHHETRELSVVYLSHKYGTMSIREWAKAGVDSWSDHVNAAGEVVPMDAVTLSTVPRFRLVSPMPFDVGARRE